MENQIISTNKPVIMPNRPDKLHESKLLPVSQPVQRQKEWTTNGCDGADGLPMPQTTIRQLICIQFIDGLSGL